MGTLILQQVIGPGLPGWCTSQKVVAGCLRARAVRGLGSTNCGRVLRSTSCRPGSKATTAIAPARSRGRQLQRILILHRATLRRRLQACCVQLPVRVAVSERARLFLGGLDLTALHRAAASAKAHLAARLHTPYTRDTRSHHPPRHLPAPSAHPPGSLEPWPVRP